MVTGASTADLAVLLVDARKGVLTQTRRHSYLAQLLGIRHFVRRDHEDGSGRFRPGGVRCDRRRLSRSSQTRSASTTGSRFRSPASAATMSASAASACPGTGAEPARASRQRAARCRGRRRQAAPPAGPMGEPARPVVPRFCRPDRVRQRRGRAWTFASCRRAARRRIARIVTADGDLDEAVAGQSVTLTFADEVDCSRGDVICRCRQSAGGRRPVRSDHRLDGRA